MKTLQECEAITTKSKLFTKTVQNVDGFDIISFDYQDGAKFEDFKEHDAFHMRGLTFVDGKPFPMLDKFFNLGEKHEGEIEEAYGKKIKSVQTKDDGSLIGHLVLPNGKVLAKTKVGLSNEWTDIANRWLEEGENAEAIRELHEQNIYPLFECVSDKHTIVLKYEWEGLKLIQARTINDGKAGHLEVEELERISDEYGWNFEKPHNHTLEELLSLKDELQEAEGFVIRFEDDSFCKIKTSWYFEKHASNEGVKRANELLGALFEGKNGAEEDYEKEFLLEASEKTLKPAGIDSVDKLKSFLFRDGSEKERGTYQQIFKKFLKEYALANKFENENTMFKLAVEGSIDDVLPHLSTRDRETAYKVIDATNAYLEEHTQKLTDALEKKLPPQEVGKAYKGYPLMGSIFKLAKREWTKEDVEGEVKSALLKETKKLQSAREFLARQKEKKC